MKKHLFIFSTLLVCFLISSCAEDGCSVEGKWTVSEVKVESAKLTASVVGIMEDEYKSSIYQFNSDGTMSITASNGDVSTGKYTFDPVGNTLKWSDDEFAAESILTVNTCSAESINLTQRMPSDPAQAETAVITMTLVQGK